MSKSEKLHKKQDIVPKVVYTAVVTKQKTTERMMSCEQQYTRISSRFQCLTKIFYLSVIHAHSVETHCSHSYGCVYLWV